MRSAASSADIWSQALTSAHDGSTGETGVRTFEHGHETVVIGAGQAGLAVSYHLKRRGRPFVILDDQECIGDAWRKRWDSLRLFTPGRYDSLPGKRFPGSARRYPAKDEVAAYLESYACESTRAAKPRGPA